MAAPARGSRTVDAGVIWSFNNASDHTDPFIRSVEQV
jgi:hypothetical protein